MEGNHDQRKNAISFEDSPTRTLQAHKDESDINLIMAKYIRSGVIEHGNANSQRYGFAPAVDFREALELINEAETQFAGLPSAIRSKFDNSAEAFLAFCEQPDAVSKLVEMGVETSKPPWKQAETPPNPTPNPTEPFKPADG